MLLIALLSSRCGSLVSITALLLGQPVSGAPLSADSLIKDKEEVCELAFYRSTGRFSESLCFWAPAALWYFCVVILALNSVFPKNKTFPVSTFNMLLLHLNAELR